MATTISEEVRAVFTADTSGLVRGVNEGKKKIAELKAAFSARTAAGNVTNTILNPSRLLDKGLDKLLVTSKLSATAIGAAAAGGIMLTRALTAGSRFANEQATAMSSLAEDMRRTSRVNVFASSADGIDSLSNKLVAARQQISDSKLAQQANDPYGFGGGLVGNVKTVVAQAAQSKADLLAEIPANVRGYAGLAARIVMPGAGNMLADQLNAVGTAGYSSADRQKDAAAILSKEQTIKGQEQAKLQRDLLQSSERSLTLARAEASGDRLRVDLARARLDLERRINDLTEKGTLTSGVRANLEDESSLQRQMAKFRHRSDYGDAVASNLSANIRPGMFQDYQRAQAARLGVQFQYGLALSRPGGMFKTENLGFQTRLREASNNENAAGLDAKRRMDAVNAGKLEVSNQRELVKLGFQDITAQTRLADLNVQAAQAAQDQAYTMGDLVKASNVLKEAVSARVQLERSSMAVQHAQGEIAYDLARRNLAIQSTNNSEISKKTQLTEASIAAAERELSLGHGLTEERKRQLRLEIGGSANDLRQLRQERGFGKSTLQIQQDLRKEANRTRALDRFDARQTRDNGLLNIHRDMNGRIVDGIDMLTGKKRGFSASAMAQPDRTPSGSNLAVMVAQRSLEQHVQTNALLEKVLQAAQNWPEAVRLR